MKKLIDFLKCSVLLLLITNLLLLSLFIVYRVDNEKTLLNIRHNYEMSSFYRVEAERNYMQAMIQKQEAETYRNEYYHEIFTYGKGIEGWYLNRSK